MARYHINPHTGNPGVCRAKNNCPYGNLETEHFDSQEAARAAYESGQLDSAFATLRKTTAQVVDEVLANATSLGGNLQKKLSHIEKNLEAEARRVVELNPDADYTNFDHLARRYESLAESAPSQDAKNFNQTYGTLYRAASIIKRSEREALNLLKQVPSAKPSELRHAGKTWADSIPSLGPEGQNELGYLPRAYERAAELREAEIAGLNQSAADREAAHEVEAAMLRGAEERRLASPPEKKLLVGRGRAHGMGTFVQCNTTGMFGEISGTFPDGEVNVTWENGRKTRLPHANLTSAEIEDALPGTVVQASDGSLGTLIEDNGEGYYLVEMEEPNDYDGTTVEGFYPHELRVYMGSHTWPDLSIQSTSGEGPPVTLEDFVGPPSSQASELPF